MATRGAAGTGAAHAQHAQRVRDDVLSTVRVCACRQLGRALAQGRLVTVRVGDITLSPSDILVAMERTSSEPAETAAALCLAAMAEDLLLAAVANIQKEYTCACRAAAKPPSKRRLELLASCVEHVSERRAKLLRRAVRHGVSLEAYQAAKQSLLDRWGYALVSQAVAAMRGQHGAAAMDASLLAGDAKGADTAEHTRRRNDAGDKHSEAVVRAEPRERSLDSARPRSVEPLAPLASATNTSEAATPAAIRPKSAVPVKWTPEVPAPAASSIAEGAADVGGPARGTPPIAVSTHQTPVTFGARDAVRAQTDTSPARSSADIPRAAEGLDRSGLRTAVLRRIHSNPDASSRLQWLLDESGVSTPAFAPPAAVPAPSPLQAAADAVRAAMLSSARRASALRASHAGESESDAQFTSRLPLPVAAPIDVSAALFAEAAAREVERARQVLHASAREAVREIAMAYEVELRDRIQQQSEHHAVALQQAVANAQRASTTSTAQRAREQYLELLRDCDREKHESIDKVRAEHARALEAVRADHERQRAKEAVDNQRAIQHAVDAAVQSAQRRHQDQMQAARAEWRREWDAELEQRLELRMVVVQQAVAEEKSAAVARAVAETESRLREAHNEDVAHATAAAANAVRTELAAELARLHSECDALRGELSVAKAEAQTAVREANEKHAAEMHLAQHDAEARLSQLDAQWHERLVGAVANAHASGLAAAEARRNILHQSALLHARPLARTRTLDDAPIPAQIGADSQGVTGGGAARARADDLVHAATGYPAVVPAVDAAGGGDPGKAVHHKTSLSPAVLPSDVPKLHAHELVVDGASSANADSGDESPSTSAPAIPPTYHDIPLHSDDAARQLLSETQQMLRETLEELARVRASAHHDPPTGTAARERWDALLSAPPAGPNDTSGAAPIDEVETLREECRELREQLHAAREDAQRERAAMLFECEDRISQAQADSLERLRLAALTTTKLQQEHDAALATHRRVIEDLRSAAESERESVLAAAEESARQMRKRVEDAAGSWKRDLEAVIELISAIDATALHAADPSHLALDDDKHDPPLHPVVRQTVEALRLLLLRLAAHHQHELARTRRKSVIATPPASNPAAHAGGMWSSTVAADTLPQLDELIGRLREVEDELPAMKELGISKRSRVLSALGACRRDAELLRLMLDVLPSDTMAMCHTPDHTQGATANHSTASEPPSTTSPVRVSLEAADVHRPAPPVSRRTNEFHEQNASDDPVQRLQNELQRAQHQRDDATFRLQECDAQRGATQQQLDGCRDEIDRLKRELESTRLDAARRVAALEARFSSIRGAGVRPESLSGVHNTDGGAAQLADSRDHVALPPAQHGVRADDTAGHGSGHERVHAAEAEVQNLQRLSTELAGAVQTLWWQFNVQESGDLGDASTASLPSAMEQCHLLATAFQTLREQAQQSTTEATALRSELQQLQQQHLLSKQQLEDALAEARTLLDERDEARAELRATTAEAALHRQELQDTSDRLHAALERCNALARERDALRLDLAQSMSEASGLQDQLTALHAQVRRVSEERDQAHSDLQAATSQASVLQEEWRQVSDRLHATLERCSALCSERDAVRSELAQAIAGTSALQDQATTSRAQADSAAAEARSLMAERNALRAEHAECAARANELQQQLGALLATLGAGTASKDDVEQPTLGTAMAQITMLQHQRDAVRQEAQQWGVRFAGMVAERDEAIARLESAGAKTLTLEQLLEAARAAAQSTAEELKLLHEDREADREALDRAAAEVQDVQQALVAARGDATRLSAELDALRALQGEQVAAAERAERIAEDTQRELTALRAHVEVCGSTISSLQEQRNACQLDLQAAEAKLEELGQQLVSTQSELEARETQLVQLQRQSKLAIRALRDELTSANEEALMLARQQAAEEAGAQAVRLQFSARMERMETVRVHAYDVQPDVSVPLEVSRVRESCTELRLNAAALCRDWSTHAQAIIADMRDAALKASLLQRRLQQDKESAEIERARAAQHIAASQEATASASSTIQEMHARVQAVVSQSQELLQQVNAWRTRAEAAETSLAQLPNAEQAEEAIATAVAAATRAECFTLMLHVCTGIGGPLHLVVEDGDIGVEDVSSAHGYEAKLKRFFSPATSDTKRFETALDVAQRECEHLHLQLNDATSMLATLRASLKASEQRADEADARGSALQAALETALANARAEAEIQLEAATESRAQLISAVQAQLHALQEEWKAEKTALEEESRAQLEALTVAHTSERMALLQRVAELETGARHTQEAHDSEISELQQRLDTATADAQALSAQLESEKQAHEDVLRQHETTVTDLQQQLQIAHDHLRAGEARLRAAEQDAATRVNHAERSATSRIAEMDAMCTARLRDAALTQQMTIRKLRDETVGSAVSAIDTWIDGMTEALVSAQARIDGAQATSVVAADADAVTISVAFDAAVECLLSLPVLTVPSSSSNEMAESMAKLRDVVLDVVATLRDAHVIDIDAIRVQVETRARAADAALAHVRREAGQQLREAEGLWNERVDTLSQQLQAALATLQRLEANQELEARLAHSADADASVAAATPTQSGDPFSPVARVAARLLPRTGGLPAQTATWLSQFQSPAPPAMGASKTPLHAADGTITAQNSPKWQSPGVLQGAATVVAEAPSRVSMRSSTSSTGAQYPAFSRMSGSIAPDTAPGAVSTSQLQNALVEKERELDATRAALGRHPTPTRVHADSAMDMTVDTDRGSTMTDATAASAIFDTILNDIRRMLDQELAMASVTSSHTAGADALSTSLHDISMTPSRRGSGDLTTLVPLTPDVTVQLPGGELALDLSKLDGIVPASPGIAAQLLDMRSAAGKLIEVLRDTRRGVSKRLRDKDAVIASLQRERLTYEMMLAQMRKQFQSQTSALHGPAGAGAAASDKRSSV